MGKKDDWCSCQGLLNRKAGMDKKEKAGRKICYFVMFAIGAVLYLGIGGADIERGMNAQKIDEYYEEKLEIFSASRRLQGEANAFAFKN